MEKRISLGQLDTDEIYELDRLSLCLCKIYMNIVLNSPSSQSILDRQYQFTYLSL